jgi:hypothetical protein
LTWIKRGLTRARLTRIPVRGLIQVNPHAGKLAPCSRRIDPRLDLDHGHRAHAMVC